MVSINLLLAERNWDEPYLIEVIVHEYYDGLFRLAVSMVQDPQLADEMVQEAVLTAVARIHQYKQGSNFKGWLFTIAINRCRQQLRQQKRREQLDRLLWWREPSPMPEEAVLQQERNQTLWQAVATLKLKHRLPIILRYIHGFSLNEIANILQMNEGTVKSRLYYAHQQLRGTLARGQS